MSTESDHNDNSGGSAADDPFAGWAEALEEQKRVDGQTIDAEQVNDIMAGRPPRPPKPASGPPSRPKDDAPGAAPTAPAPAA